MTADSCASSKPWRRSLNLARPLKGVFSRDSVSCCASLLKGCMSPGYGHQAYTRQCDATQRMGHAVPHTTTLAEMEPIDASGCRHRAHRNCKRAAKTGCPPVYVHAYLTSLGLCDGFLQLQTSGAAQTRKCLPKSVCREAHHIPVAPLDPPHKCAGNPLDAISACLAKWLPCACSPS